MKKIKLLYLEDDPFLGRVVKETLELQGYEVLMLTHSLNVLEQWQGFIPDMGIFDVMLPHKSGYEVAEEIRVYYPNTPIVFLTAKTETSDVVKGFESGGNDYLRKPFSLEELMVRVENLLKITRAKEEPVQQNQFSIGDYTLDTLMYELRLGNEARKLTHREMELLQFFAEHRNQVVSRQQILLKIWNDDSFFNSRNLDVYTTRLRQFLKKDPNIKIHTIRGVGYKVLIP